MQLTLPGLAASLLEREESPRQRDRRISVAACAFLSARERLAGASGAELAVATIELDDALHELTLAAGFDAPECYCERCEALRELTDEIRDIEGI